MSTKERRQEVPPELLERFCQGLAKGLSKGAAYKEAGLGEGKKQNSIYTLAGKLAQWPEVQQRVKEIQSEVLEQARQEVPTEEIFNYDKFLLDVIMGKITDRGEQARLSDRLQAVRIKAQIDGRMSNKTDLSGDMVINVRVRDNDEG
jgi:hypothetical protein